MSDRFAVWAPRAERVELLQRGERHPMSAESGGWWGSDQPWAPDTDYAFALDGGDPLPDPRSPSQPEGVHGSSRTVDHAAFGWTDDAWRPTPLADAIIYEAHIGTFTAAGTFDAAVERLDYLAELGITHLELLPVVEFSGDRGWGYDGVDLFAPHHAYGGPDGLKRLVDAAHRRGLAVLLDVVYNHLGPEGNYLGRFGPYFSDKYRTPWGEAVNYDERGSDEVRRFVTDNVRMWLRDYHIDGLRLDAVHAVFDSSPLHICEEIAGAADEVAAETGRPVAITVESDANDPRLVRSPSIGGYGLAAVWADDLHHTLHVNLTGEETGYYADFGGLSTLAEALREPFLRPGGYRSFRHRVHGRSPEGLDGDRFIVSLQNHDQVGNRARGERIGQLVSPGRAKAGAALLLTAPYVPLLFAGEEWGASTPFLFFTGHAGRALAAAVRRGRRAEFAAFGWNPRSVPDPQAPATFTASRLDWTELERGAHAEILQWYRALIRLRKERPGLRDGYCLGVQVTCDAAAGWLTVRRGAIGIGVNLGAMAADVPLSGRSLLATDGVGSGSRGGLRLPPDGVAVVELT